MATTSTTATAADDNNDTSSTTKKNRFFISRIYSNNPLVRDSLAIDLEWLTFTGEYADHKTRMISIGISSNFGKRYHKHIVEFENDPSIENPERALLLWIIDVFRLSKLFFTFNGSNVKRFLGEEVKEFKIRDEKTGKPTGEVVKRTVKKYDGHDSDLMMLYRRCKYQGLLDECPIDVYVGKDDEYQNPIPVFKDREIRHVDLWKVFSKPVVSTSIFRRAYRNNRLTTITKALLGKTKLTYIDPRDGKRKEIDGKIAQTLPLALQTLYVVNDAELTMSLAIYNDCLILEIHKYIAEIMHMDDFTKCCNSNVTTWFTKKYDYMHANGLARGDYDPAVSKWLRDEYILPTEEDIEAEKNRHLILQQQESKKNKKSKNKVPSQEDLELKQLQIEKTPKTKSKPLNCEAIVGGHSLDPVPGFYREPTDEYDVKGMYPWIAIHHGNISHESWLCACCINDPDALMDEQRYNEINRTLIDNGQLPWRARPWICQNMKRENRMAAFPQVVNELREERTKYQKLLEDEEAKSEEEQNKEKIIEYNARQLAYKVTANAGAGAYGQKHFKYFNPVVESAINGTGRLIHKELIRLAKEEGFIPTYGFTDGIMVIGVADPNNPQDKTRAEAFRVKCEQLLNIKLGHKQRRPRQILFPKKNRYIGMNEDGSVSVENLDGTSVLYPNWIRQQIKHIAELVIRSDRGEEEQDRIFTEIEKVFDDLDKGLVPAADLKFKQKLNKPLSDYNSDPAITRTIVIAKQLGADLGDIIYWYETGVKAVRKKNLATGEFPFSIRKEDISYTAYKRILWSKIAQILYYTREYKLERLLDLMNRVLS